MAKILEYRMRQKYGNNIYPFPTIVFDSKYEGWGYASYNNQIITIPPKFFTLSKGDQASTLLHEYTHYTHDKNKINIISQEMKDALGNIIPYNTGILTVVSDDGKTSIRNQLLIECPTCTKETINYEVNYGTRNTYYYRCSNYWKDEIFARQAELQGEKDKLYQLTEIYRNFQLDFIEKALWEYQRSLDYEKNNGRNPDGSKK